MHVECVNTTLFRFICHEPRVSVCLFRATSITFRTGPGLRQARKLNIPNGGVTNVSLTTYARLVHANVRETGALVSSMNSHLRQGLAFDIR